MIPGLKTLPYALLPETRYASQLCRSLQRVGFSSVKSYGKSTLYQRNSVSTCQKKCKSYGKTSLRQRNPVSTRQENCDHLMVIGTGGNEIKPTLLMEIGESKYWFNFGEGTHQWTRESSTFTIGNPFLLLTKVSWDNVGDWQSFYMSLPEQYKCTTGCMGPLKCKHVLHDLYSRTLGKYAFRYVEEYEDKFISISNIQLGCEDDLVAYFCKKRDDFGFLDADKAISLGVPMGPAFRVLKEGGDYVTDDGRTIKSCEVVGPSKKGAAFIVLECPDERYIDDICTNRQLQPTHYRDQDIPLDVIVHITPLNILETDQYCKWMSEFGPNVSHILLHSSVCPAEVSWRRDFEFHMPFHLMNPEVYHFPILPKRTGVARSSLKMSKYLLDSQVNIGYSGLRYILKHSGCCFVDASMGLPPLHKDIEEAHRVAKKYCDESIESYQHSINGSVQKVRKEFIANVHPPAKLTKFSDCMVTFLGTGATVPTRYRNTSSILLQTLADGNILLDCGLGTVIQLVKCFGEQRAWNIIGNIRIIFISHMHLDHWAGLINLLRQSFAINGLASPVTVIGPYSLYEILQIYDRNFSDTHWKFVDSHHIVNNPMMQSDLYLKAIQVQHIENSFGISVSKNLYWKIVYSGDTIPCYNILKEGRNANLLIHEGTYDNTIFRKEAKVKRHSFYKEAVRVAAACNAGFTAITHFNEQSRPLAQPPYPFVVPAVDLMSLKISDIERHRLDSKECNHVYNSVHKMLMLCQLDT